MSNKYLEKVASLFPSIKYQKSLDKDEKERYARHYANAGQASVGKALKIGAGTGLLSAGVGFGMVGGILAGRKVGQKLSRRILEKNVVKGVGKIGPGEYDISKSIEKAQKIHGITRPVGMAAGAIAGSIPGSSIIDHVRHNHAKGVMERKRKENE